MHWRDLPRLGLGLSADVAGSKPDYKRFVGRRQAGVDYFSVGAHYNQGKRVAYYLADLKTRHGLRCVFHPINFNVASSAVEPAEFVNGVADMCRFLGAHWVGQDIGIWMIGGVYQDAFLLPPILSEASVADTSQKAIQLNRALPCPFLVENPPFGSVMGSMHVIDFMNEVSRSADCGLVVDIGHLMAYQLAIGEPVDALPISRLHADRVVEIHLAGLQRSSLFSDGYIDRHDLPILEEEWEIAADLVGRCTNLKGITLEQEFCEEDLVEEHISKARKVIRRHAASWR